MTSMYLEYCLTVVATSTIPFIGLFISSQDDLLDKHPLCELPEPDRSNVIDSKLLLALSFLKLSNVEHTRKLLYLILAIIVHTINSFLILKLTNKFMMINRRYCQKVRLLCSLIAGTMFALHVTRIEIIDTPELPSIRILVALMLSLFGSISIFESTIKSNQSFYVVVLSAISFLISIVVHPSTVAIPIVALLYAIRQRSNTSENIKTDNKSVGSMKLWLTIVEIAVTVCVLAVIGYGYYTNSLKQIISLTQIKIKFMNTVRALMSINYLKVVYSVGKPLDQYLQAAAKIVKSQLYLNADVESSRMELNVIKVLLSLATLQFIYNLLRFKKVTNFSVCCMSLLLLLVPVCTNVSWLRGDTEAEEPNEALTLSRDCYVVASFMCMCLGE